MFQYNKKMFTTCTITLNNQVIKINNNKTICTSLVKKQNMIK